MTFAARITRAPRAYNPDRAKDVSERFSDQPAALRDLISGTAGCSGYLASLLTRHEDWLRAAVDARPEDTLTALCQFSQTGAEATLSDLRIAKGRAALLIALADLGGVWSLEETTRALTTFADAATGHALQTAFAQECQRKPMPDTQAPLGGLAIFAMGKMGAFELNYSSDIDLIVLFDEDAYARDDQPEARARLIKVTQRMVKLLSATTGDGYVFRTDLRLRPDPSVTPVCASMEAAERYYEALGRTWERAAWIKARVIAGDMEAGARFLKTMRPFVWRRHLDFAAVQEAHDMRLRIREHKGLAGQLALPGHDMKLGQGGIREIEFFTQTRQLISGGRDDSLRSPATVPALEALAQGNWITETDQITLTDAYRWYREIEHRLQMVEDAQTHALPRTDDGFERLAAFLGEPDRAAFCERLKTRLGEVRDLTEPFFSRDTDLSAPALEAFSNPENITSATDRWTALPALRSERAREIFERLLPRITTALAHAANPDEAFTHFETFLAGLPAGVQVFSLFDANPSLLDLLSDICATAPDLARYLGRNAGVLDAVLSPTYFDSLPDQATLSAALAERIAGMQDYETTLDEIRRWQKEVHFRIGVHLLRKLATPEQAMTAYSNLAEACVSVLLPVVQTAFAERYGDVPGSSVGVIAMGRLGSHEMSPASDLDLIVVYDADGQAASDGKRSLAASTYFARLTQMLITALTAPTSEGVLYPTDMRLRPSGRKGPVAVSLKGFASYQLNDAWTWEHLALTRARVVAGPDGLKSRIEDAIDAALNAPREASKTAQDVIDMRARLAQVKASAGDPKQGPGGLLDIDLFVQTGALMSNLHGVHTPARMITDLAGCNWLEQAEATTLTKARRDLSLLQLVGRLVSGEAFDTEGLGEGAKRLLLSLAQADTLDDLLARIAQDRTDSAAIITTRLEGLSAP